MCKKRDTAARRVQSSRRRMASTPSTRDYAVGLHRILKLSLLPHPGQRIRASGFSTPTRNSLSHLLHVTPLVSARSFCRASRRFCSILQISRSSVFDVIVRLLFPCYCCWMGRGNAQPANAAYSASLRGRFAPIDSTTCIAPEICHAGEGVSRAAAAGAGHGRRRAQITASTWGNGKLGQTAPVCRARRGIGQGFPMLPTARAILS